MDKNDVKYLFRSMCRKIGELFRPDFWKSYPIKIIATFVFWKNISKTGKNDIKVVKHKSIIGNWKSQRWIEIVNKTQRWLVMVNSHLSWSTVSWSEWCRLWYFGSSNSAKTNFEVVIGNKPKLEACYSQIFLVLWFYLLNSFTIIRYFFTIENTFVGSNLWIVGA